MEKRNEALITDGLFRIVTGLLDHAHRWGGYFGLSYTIGRVRAGGGITFAICLQGLPVDLYEECLFACPECDYWKWGGGKVDTSDHVDGRLRELMREEARLGGALPPAFDNPTD